MSDLRREFWDEMEKVSNEDRNVLVITGDLGFSFCEKYAENHPFINCGCIEQSMVGIAAGMALGGKKPYVYSGSVFLLARAYEQIRDDVCYNNLDVKLIGTGASGFLGMSHNWLGSENEEDLLKNLPNLQRFYPKSREELNSALRVKGCAYIRI